MVSNGLLVQAVKFLRRGGVERVNCYARICLSREMLLGSEKLWLRVVFGVVFTCYLASFQLLPNYTDHFSYTLLRTPA